MRRLMIPELKSKHGLGALQKRDYPLAVALVFWSLLHVFAREEDTARLAVRAYIDPGSGALAVQLLVSFGVGLLLYLKRVRQALWRLLGRLRGRGKGPRAARRRIP